MTKEQCKNCETIQIPNVSGCTCYGNETNSWESVQEILKYYNVEDPKHIIELQLLRHFSDIKEKVVSQEKEKWARQCRVLLKDDISHEWEEGWNKALLYFNDLLQKNKI